MAEGRHIDWRKIGFYIALNYFDVLVVLQLDMYAINKCWEFYREEFIKLKKTKVDHSLRFHFGFQKKKSICRWVIFV